VVSIGGITAGGTGKTPMALLVGSYLKRKGREVAFLSRGYRRQSKETVIVEPRSNVVWKDVGDEPALLHANMPESWLGIGSDRCATIRKMLPRLSEKAVFVLDDGFQHRRVRRTRDILCVPANVFDDLLLPAGTLREPLKGMKRANCICIMAGELEEHDLEETRHKVIELNNRATIVVLQQRARGWVRLATGATSDKLPLLRPLLMCGIARPERFTDLVRSLAVRPAKEVTFRDHHAFTARQIQALCRGQYDGILTTEKDAQRLLTLNLVNCPDIWYLKMDLRFSDSASERDFFSFLNNLIL